MYWDAMLTGYAENRAYIVSNDMFQYFLYPGLSTPHSRQIMVLLTGLVEDTHFDINAHDLQTHRSYVFVFDMRENTRFQFREFTLHSWGKFLHGQWHDFVVDRHLRPGDMVRFRWSTTAYRLDLALLGDYVLFPYPRRPGGNPVAHLVALPPPENPPPEDNPPHNDAGTSQSSGSANQPGKSRKQVGGSKKLEFKMSKMLCNSADLSICGNYTDFLNEKTYGVLIESGALSIDECLLRLFVKEAKERIKGPRICYKFCYNVIVEYVMSAFVAGSMAVKNAKELTEHVIHVLTDLTNSEMNYSRAQFEVKVYEDCKFRNSSLVTVFSQLESGIDDAMKDIINSKSKMLNIARLYLLEMLSFKGIMVDSVALKDLTRVWEIKMDGKVNGVVKTCFGSSEMDLQTLQYVNFTNPLIMEKFDLRTRAVSYGMNLFDQNAWRIERKVALNNASTGKTW